MRIINLTQHRAAPEQVADGVREARDRDGLEKLLTFAFPPTRAELVERATALAELAQSEGASAAMIGGAPYLMAPLEVALRAAGVKPLYAFAVRDSIEEPLPDGKGVSKVQVFRHAGWVEA